MKKIIVANIILAGIRKDGGIAVATALSVIAATLLKLGLILHQKFAIPVPCHDDSCSNHILDPNDSKNIKESNIITIDKISMMHLYLLDLLDRYLKALMGNNLCIPIVSYMPNLACMIKACPGVHSYMPRLGM